MLLGAIYSQAHAVLLFSNEFERKVPQSMAAKERGMKHI
jgi:hypothetical protein